ncbi:hypothetical protein AOXY_G23349 [Acipenser oxyrinchus oxyrinchus]|uniref:Ectonucleoside triphosphate diphosphohydrolase 8 n=1 Tax=Acipenser oxyrinchus oxyrinchus TaxID=40147 RepID=A0AAD8CV08_ACIOX|nr:hypothetical protein AOXY_G23349 [Acipenser oxyrinchus oxyrinchus]
MQFMNSVLAKLMKPEPYLPDSRVRFTGSGSPAQCESLIKTFFNFSACARKLECSFNGVYQPPVHGNFFLKTDFPTEKENNLREYCATSYYITTLLIDAYRFDNQSWNKIVFEKVRDDDTNIGWTLGYMLNLTNLIPTETPAR